MLTRNERKKARHLHAPQNVAKGGLLPGPFLFSLVTVSVLGQGFQGVKEFVIAFVSDWNLEFLRIARIFEGVHLNMFSRQ